MYSNIVRVQSGKEFGSGIIIEGNMLLTAAHEVDESGLAIVKHGERSYRFGIVKKNDCVALLASDDKCDLEFNERIHFTTTEVLDDESEYTVEGFRTDAQTEYIIQGKGLICKKSEDNAADYILGKITEGTAYDYHGLSGAPVICNGRAVGILQIQNYDNGGKLGIEFSSADTFADILPESEIRESEYISTIRKICVDKCNKEIARNKRSKKYIPEIFVEEGDYKEKLRYLSDSRLFTRKALEDLQGLDFTSINALLKSHKRGQIDFRLYSESDDSTEIIEGVDRAIELINKIEGDITGSGLIREKYYIERNALNSSMLYALGNIQARLRYTEYRAVVFTKNAGQGKTNFLCDFTENFLLRREYLTLYFNAYEFVEKPSKAIWDILTEYGQIERAYAIKALDKYYKFSHKPFVVVIDGLNENSALNDFGQYMYKALEELMKQSFVRIVMTTRSEFYDTRFRQLTSDALGKSFHHEVMESGNEQFRRRIFNGYLKYFEVSFDSSSSYERAFNRLSEDTLILRIFCDVNQGKRGVPFYDNYKYALFESYYCIKRKDATRGKNVNSGNVFDNLIKYIVDYMLEHKSFDSIPMECLDSQEVDMAVSLLESDVLFSSDVITRKGLREQNVQMIRFSTDELRDFCIARYMVTENDEDGFGRIWGQMHEEHWAVCEGVERYVFGLARTTDKNIMPLINSGYEYAEIYWNNVFSLEDEDLTDEDIDIWKNQYRKAGKYRTRIAKYLIGRRLMEYFDKASISLFFDILEEVAADPVKYSQTIEMLFPHSEKDGYGIRLMHPQSVFECDEFAIKTAEHIDKMSDQDCSSRLTLSVYIYSLDIGNMRELWEKAYENNQPLAEKVLKSFVERNELPAILKVNVMLILNDIGENAKDNSINMMGELANNMNKYDRINSSLNRIWTMA